MNLYYKRAAMFGLGLRQRTQQCQNVGTDSSSSGGRTHYEVLGVHRVATQKEIKEAYLQMSRKVGKESLYSNNTAHIVILCFSDTLAVRKHTELEKRACTLRC